MKRAWTGSKTLRPYKKKKTLSSRIEKLLDDVLLLVLSHLTFAEAARTSLLSQRWGKLWCSLPSLHFGMGYDASLAPDSVYVTRHRCGAAANFCERSKKSKKPNRCCSVFVERVNKVVEARPPGFTLTHLNFQHELHPTLRTHVDNWFRFAVTNKVENFHLDLIYKEFQVPLHIEYTLKVDEWCKTPSALANFKFLKSLAIKYVTLTREFIEFILSNCQLLETLDLASVGEITGLEISGTSLQLRCLRLSSDPFINLFTLDKLSAPNLTCFDYKGPKLGLQTAEVPKLVDLYIGGGNVNLHPPIKEFLLPFWPYLSQLQKLEIRITEYQQLEITELPKLQNLRHLTLADTIREADYEFPGLLSIMKECPVLQSLKIKSFYFSYPNMGPADLIQESFMRAMDPCFQSLKEFAFKGASWKILCLELTRCIIENSPHLEKLIFQSCGGLRGIKDLNLRAEKLRAILNVGTTVTII